MGALSLALAILLQAAAPQQPVSSTPDAPAGQAPSPGASAPSATEQAPAPPETYTYDPDGRRDPFLSLLAAGENHDPSVPRGEGVAGMTVSEISVRGILQSRGSFMAMVQGPDDRTYMVRAGDRLADGTVQSVTPEGLVIVQVVNDPLSLVKQRTVRKLLRSLEDAKQ